MVPLEGVRERPVRGEVAVDEDARAELIEPVVLLLGVVVFLVAGGVLLRLLGLLVLLGGRRRRDLLLAVGLSGR